MVSTLPAEPMVGVACPVCGEESFQLLDRQAQLSPKTTLLIKCCQHCARRVDLENEERVEAETLEGLTKIERKLAIKARSREWARSWEGKRVVVRYDVSNGHDGTILKRNCRIRGTAFTACKEDIGWGRVKVVIDESEYYRISFVKDNEYHPDQKSAVIDGKRWGLGTELVSHYLGYDRDWNGQQYEYVKPYCFYVHWGDRNHMVLEEFDAEAERLAVEEDKKRRQAELEREAARHMGEGI